MANTFEQQLTEVVASSIALEPESKPMIIMGFHNPMIITEYVVERHYVPTVQDSVPDIIEVDHKFQQKILERVEQQGRKFHTLLWEQVIPLLIGFETADTDIQQELNLIFGNSISVSLDPYRRIMRESAYIIVLSHVAKELGISKEQADLLLRSKLDEAQTKRSGANAGPL